MVSSSSSSDLHTLFRLWLPWPGHSSGWTLLSPSLCSPTHARLLFLWILSPLYAVSNSEPLSPPSLPTPWRLRLSAFCVPPNGFRTGLSRKSLARKGLWMGGAEKGKEGLCAASDIYWNWPVTVVFLPNQLTNQPSFIPRSLCWNSWELRVEYKDTSRKPVSCLQEISGEMRWKLVIKTNNIIICAFVVIQNMCSKKVDLNHER